MALIVQKFGGTSVADSEKILAAARKAVRAHQQGNQVVMVVSAMGKNTDRLVELANEVNERPPAREMDMLLSTGEQVSVALMAMAIDSLGYSAVSLTGGQIGILTDSSHTKARIQSISTERMQELLDAGKIVIAAGFQGIDENLDITTLGRGGSDTTAVALAAVLGADACEIYTDVDGVYTTDPRILPEARRVKWVSYDEMLELASLGASVMHNRSIEFAKKFSVPIHVRSSFSDIEGSFIGPIPESDATPVCGAALTRDEARVTIRNVPDVPGSSYELFSRIAKERVTVDMIVQNVADNGLATISFTVPRDELRVTLDTVNAANAVIGSGPVTHDEAVAKVSVVGLGMAEQAGVAQRMFRTLAENQINIQMITTSEIKISVLVSRDQALPALRTVHQAFHLDEAPPAGSPTSPDSTPSLPASPEEVVARLQGHGMEDLTIHDIELDSTQARVTVSALSNSPGIAATVFEAVAEAGIFVDMIVQSYTDTDHADLSFTVPENSATATVEVLEQLADKLQFANVSSSTEIDKLSVSGIGLHSHTGVAIRMFQTLAETGINVEMINTSEVRVNVIVAGGRGEEALAKLQAAFADSLR